MEVSSAVDLINALIYKPQWKINAEDHTNRFEGTVRVRIEYPAFKSERTEAPMGYPNTMEAYASFAFIVLDLDDREIYRRIIDAVIEIETHEAREFLRVLPTYWAPFHPHRIDGMKRWGDVVSDLKFGVC